MSADVLNVRCIRCGAEGSIRDEGLVAACRWIIAWGAPLELAGAGGAPPVDQSWEGPGWPWRCPRCAPDGRARA